MSHRRFHWLEKTQVQIATGVALAAVYFLLWPMLQPWDAQGPALYVHYGNWATLAVLAGIFLGLAVLAGAITVKSRPEGALLVALFAVGGVSLRSGQLRQAAFTQADGMRPLFLQMLSELLILAAVLLIGAAVICLVRRMIGAVNPNWIWHDILADLAMKADADATAGRQRAGSPQAGSTRAPAGRLGQTIGCLLVSLAIAVPLLMLLLQSSDRGQILFALLVSCLLAMLIAHQLIQAQYGFVAWVMPMLLGAGVYGLAIVHSVQGGANAWMDAALISRALPIDWMTAGAGGAVLGYWISERIHEIRHFEKKEKEQENV